MLKWIKIIFLFIFSTVFIFILGGLFFYQHLRFSTPTLNELAKKISPFSSAVAFTYSRDIDKQLFILSKNIGFEKNSSLTAADFQEGNIGATGFFVLNLQPQQSQPLMEKIDNVLGDVIQLVDETNNSEQPNTLPPSHRDQEDSDSPFAAPLASLLEEIWNGNTLLIGGATQFYLSPQNALLISLEPLIRKISHQKGELFKDIIHNNVPIYVQNFLYEHSLHVSVATSPQPLNFNIHQSEIILSIDNSEDFIDSFCSPKLNPWDICGRFSLNRWHVRHVAQSLLGLVNNHFKVTFKVYWTMLGKDIVYSNQIQFVEKVLQKNQETHPNILTDVSSSGDDSLFSNLNHFKYLSLSFYFDLIQSQNEGISFVETLRKKSQFFNDYFSSPEGEELFQKTEKSINEATSYCQKASLGFYTDGNVIFPELRMYSPSRDLFVNNEMSLSPEFYNSLRVFVTKAVSLGDFVLPRGLLPLPGPYLKRNGKWVILKSEVVTQSLAPYLQSVDPFLDELPQDESLE